MARKQGRIIRRGHSAWLVRIYRGRDPQTGTRKYLNQTHSRSTALGAALTEPEAESRPVTYW
jgi:hypothetical protein